MNPLGLPGPKFLMFYAICVGAAAIFLWVLRSFLTAGKAGSSEGMHPYELSVVHGGPKNATYAAVATLLHEGLLETDGENIKPGTKNIEAEQVAPRTYRDVTQKRRHRFDEAILSSVHKAGECSLEQLETMTQDEGEALQESAEERGFVVSKTNNTIVNNLNWLPILLLGGLAAAKALVGLTKGRPITLLLFATVFMFVLLSALFGKTSRRSHHGLAHLDSLRKEFVALKTTVASSPAQLDAEEFALAFALFPSETIASNPDQQKLLGQTYHVDPSWDGTVVALASTGSSGCSSCSSCSSCASCGGGCGGGCGGCA